MVLKHNEEKRDTAAPDGKMLIKTQQGMRIQSFQIYLVSEYSLKWSMP